MGCPRPACAECSKNCLLLHGKNADSSAVVISFFKILIADNCADVLFLPPKIARTVPDLIDKKTQLEDASGQRWTVTLSKRDGSLAFYKGWRTFFLEHALEVGDFVVFHYITGSHFVVQIYGRNGCEKINFCEENGSRKKRRTNRHSSAKDAKNHSIDDDLMNEQGPSTSALSDSNVETSQSQPMVTENTLNTDTGNGTVQPPPKTLFTEETFYMIDREARQGHEDQRNYLYDLLNSEMQTTSGVEGTNRVLEHEKSPFHGNKMPKSQAGADLVDEIPVVDKRGSSPAVSDAPNMEIRDQNEDFQTMENEVSVSGKDSSNGNTTEQEQRKKTKSSNDQVSISHKEDTPLVHSSQSAQKKFAGMTELCGLQAHGQTEKCLSRERMNVAKAKQEETSKEDCGFSNMVHGKEQETKERDQNSDRAVDDKARVCKVVKTEPVDTFEYSSVDVVSISLMVEDRQPYLELPMCLPYVSFRKRSGTERKAVVLLRDPVLRLWPVLYHEKYEIRVLASGWEAFAKANRIQPGDGCSFDIEDAINCIYKVGIVRK